MRPFSISRRAALAALSSVPFILPLRLHAAETASWPRAKPITWLVGFAPGGTADVITRLAAHKLAEKTGQSVIVENRPGASGILALQVAAKAEPDGYTLITLPGPILYNQAVPELGKELRAVALLAKGPMVLVAQAKTKPSTLQQLVAAIRQDPNSWSYASSGKGTSQHLAGELFNVTLGTKMVHVPYKGGGQAVADVLGGQVPLAFLGVAPVLPHIRAGKLKAYAVTTRFRIESLPQVPTFQESGFKDYEASQWFAVGTQTAVPDAYVNRLNGWLAEIMASPELKEALLAAGTVAGNGSAQAAAGFVAADQKRWKSLAKDVQLELD